jgi:hypothetical protein
MNRLSVVTAVTLFVTAPIFSAHGQGIWTQQGDGIPVQLGDGWDATQNAPITIRCIANGVEQIDKTQTSYETIGEVDDKSQVMKGLNMSVNVQVSGLLGSANAKFSYANSSEVDTETLTIAVYSSVINGPHYLGLPERTQEVSDKLSSLASPAAQQQGIENINSVQADAGEIYANQLRLTKDAFDLWKNHRDTFYKTCGTHYVLAFREGGEIIGFLSKKDASSAEKTSIDAALSGSAFGQSVSSNLSTSIASITADKTLNISWRKSSGWGDQQPTEVNGLLKAVSDLPNQAAHYPARIAVLIEPYSKLPQLQGTEETDSNSQQLETLLERYWRFEALYSDFLAADADKSDYISDWGITSTAFDNALQATKDTMTTVKQTISSCSSKKGCTLPDNLSSLYDLRPILPLRKRSFPADIALRDSATTAQSAVDQFNSDRTAHMRTADSLPFFAPAAYQAGANCFPGQYLPNHIFTQWSVPTWLNTVWPKIAAFENQLKTYPAALKAQIDEVRLAAPWREACTPTGEDQDCIPVHELRERQDEVQTTPRQDSVNGTGVFPGGEATRCADNVTAKFSPNID